MSAKPYTMDDVQAWVEMLWERERLDEMTMARIRATVEECDALKAQVEAARKTLARYGRHNPSASREYRQGCDDVRLDVLDAMDEATK